MRENAWGAVLAAALLLAVATAGTASAELEYIEVLTQQAAAEDPLPIVVAMHGLGDRPEAFRLLLDDLKAKARVIVPRAPTPYGNDGGAWFDLHAGDSEIARGVGAAADQIAELIESVRDAHASTARVILTGFSQGGVLAFAVAAAHPELVHVAVPVAGYLPIPMWPAKRPTVRPLPRILALHGEADHVVPVQSAKWSVEALRSNGFETELRSYPDLGHTISRDERAALHEALVAAVAELTPKPEPAAPAEAATEDGKAAPAGEAAAEPRAAPVAEPQPVADDAPSQGAESGVQTAPAAP